MTQSKHIELAVNTKQLESFIKVLYAAVAAVSSDQTSNKVASAVSGWASGAKAIEKLLGTDILDQLVTAAKTGELDEDEIVPAARALRKSVREALKTDNSVQHTELDMLNALSTYLLNRSDTALAKAVKLLPVLGEPELTGAFVKKANSQSEFIKPLQKIVQAFTKEKGRSVLTAEEGAELKAKNPKVYKEYLRLRKSYNQVWKDELRNFVFKSKKQLVDFDAAFKYLTSKGIQNPLPATYEGMIDANGALYTSAGKKINGFPGPGFSIQMNPDYNPKSDDSYVFTTINDSTGKRSQHVYTVDYRSNAIKQKFEKVQDLDKDIDAVRKKWLVAMKKTDKSIECVAATALEMMYQFSARVGSMGNSAGGEATFGISTLLGKHCKIDGDKITIAYTGKGGVKQVHKLQASTPEAKILVKNMKMLLADKGPKDRVFTFIGKSGRELPMTGGIINKVFQRLGAKATVHKLRHVRGTRLFNELVEHNKAKIFNEKKPLSEAQAVAMFKQLATKVGELLGHVRGVGASQKVTPSTAIQNYIDPGSMKNFFAKLGYRAPKFLEKLKG